MAKPWEKYRQQQAQPEATAEPAAAAGSPWLKYQQQQPAQVEQMQPAQPAMQQPGAVVTAVTGAGREAPETMDLPEIYQSGLLAGSPVEAKDRALAPILLTATDPEEIAQIMTENYPQVGVAYQLAPDGSVYPVLRNNETGAATVINRPGLSGQDVLQTLGIAAAYAPTGAGTVRQAALRSGLMGTGVEAAQTAAGGEFDPLVPVLDAAFGAGGQAVANLLPSLRSGSPTVKKAAEQRTKQFVRERFSSEYGRPPSKEVEDGIVRALIKGDQEELVRFAQPEQAVIEAGEQLGLREPGLLSAVSASPEFRAQEQVLKSIPTSPLRQVEEQAISELQQRADELITQFGGTLEKGGLSERLAAEATETIDGMAVQADKIYDELDKLIPANTQVDVKRLEDAIAKEIADAGGRADQLSTVEKNIRRLIEPPKELRGTVAQYRPTYRSVDKIRKDIGEAIGKKSGPFRDAGRADLSKYYSLLTEVQENAAPDHTALWSRGKALVQQRKGLEENAQKAFGKELNEAFMPKIGAAARELPRGQYKRFDTLMNSIPKESRQEVMTSALNDVFTGGRRAQQQLSIGEFSNWYNQLNRDPALKNRIYKHLDPELTQLVDAMGVRVNALNRALKKEERTGRILSAPTVTARLLNGVGSLIAKTPGFIGEVARVGVEGSKDSGNRAAVELLSDPTFMGNISKLVTAQAESAERKIMRSQAFKKFLRTMTELGDPSASAIGRIGLRNWLLSLGEQAEEERPVFTQDEEGLTVNVYGD